MEITCDIAMDLVDIYTSGGASEDTQKAVREHLKSCRSCEEFYSDYKKDILKEPADKKISIAASPQIAEDVLSATVRKLSKRLRTRRIIRNTVSVVTISLGVALTVKNIVDIVNNNE